MIGKNPNEIRDFLEQGGTWQELINMPNSYLEAQYSNGYDLYYEGRYEEAIEAFTSLTILNPYQPKFWFSLGAALQQANRQEEAMQAYQLSSAIDPDNPDPLMQAARCAKALNKTAECTQLLQQATAIRSARQWTR